MFANTLAAAALVAFQLATAAPLKSHNHMPVDRFFREGVIRHTTVTIYASSTTTVYAPGASPAAQMPAAKPSSQSTVAPSNPAPIPAVAPVEAPPKPSVAAVSVQAPAEPAPAPAPMTTPAAVVAPSAAPQPAISSSIVTVQAPAVVSNAGTSGTTGSDITADMIKAIMPSAASCANAPFPSECRTADQAAPLFAQSFTKYNINSKAAQAAVLALVALESGELKYNKAHYGDVVAGKGTRNMQYPNFNQKYATDALGAGAIAGKDAAGILTALLANDATDFGSAAWFLSTQCPSVLQQFSTNPTAAWTAYLGPGCVGTTDTAQRDGYWTAAKKALGVVS